MKLPAYLTKAMRAEIVRDSERLRFLVKHGGNWNHVEDDGVYVWINDRGICVHHARKDGDVIAAIDGAIKEYESEKRFRRGWAELPA